MATYRNRVALTGLSLAVALAMAMPARAADTAGTDAFALQVDAAAQFEAGDDPAVAERALTKALRDPRFASLPLDTQRRTLSVAAWVAAIQDNLPLARERYLQAIAVDDSDPDNRLRLAMVEFDLGHHDAATRALARLLEQRPDLSNHLPQSFIGSLVWQSAPGSADRLATLQALLDANYTNQDLGADAFWYELAVARMVRGEQAAAADVITRIHDPTSLIKLRVDRRFDALVDRGDPHYDIGRAAQAQMDELRTRAMLDPTRVDLLMQLSYAMLAMGQHQDLIAMADAALAVTNGKMEKTSPFQSVEDRVWLMNNRTIALRRVGRIEEALSQLQFASTQRESADQRVNVSQVLNLGSFYCALGRAQDALDAIKPVGDMSGYGKMVHSMVKLRAYRQLGRHDEANRELQYLREHRKDSPEIHVRALIVSDLVEEAAATYIAQLDDAETRAEALLLAQRFKAPAPLPGNRAADERWDRLLERADVRAAIDRVGRVEQYPIYNLDLD